MMTQHPNDSLVALFVIWAVVCLAAFGAFTLVYLALGWAERLMVM